MVTSADSVLLGRPLAEVFALTVDLPGQPRWDQEIEAVPGERVVEHDDLAGLIWMIANVYSAEGHATRLIRQVEVQPAGMVLESI
jgi:hypothetical protein